MGSEVSVDSFGLGGNSPVAEKVGLDVLVDSKEGLVVETFSGDFVLGGAFPRLTFEGDEVAGLSKGMPEDGAAVVPDVGAEVFAFVGDSVNKSTISTWSLLVSEGDGAEVEVSSEVGGEVSYSSGSTSVWEGVGA